MSFMLQFFMRLILLLQGTNAAIPSLYVTAAFRKLVPSSAGLSGAGAGDKCSRKKRVDY